MLTALFAFLLASADAAELSGVKAPDAATVGGQTLVLNGLGLREKYFFDIYVGALYLPAKTTSGSSAISQDVPKRITMTFIYSSGVTKEQLAEAYDEGLAYDPNAAAVKDRFTQMKGWLTNVGPNDVISFDYVPGTGTTVTVKGVNKGTIPGKDFMQSLWGVYLGDHPPTAKLKSGMLGQ